MYAKTLRYTCTSMVLLNNPAPIRLDRPGPAVLEVAALPRNGTISFDSLDPLASSTKNEAPVVNCQVCSYRCGPAKQVVAKSSSIRCRYVNVRSISCSIYHLQALEPRVSNSESIRMTSDELPNGMTKQPHAQTFSASQHADLS